MHPCSCIEARSIAMKLKSVRTQLRKAKRKASTLKETSATLIGSTNDDCVVFGDAAITTTDDTTTATATTNPNDTARSTRKKDRLEALKKKRQKKIDDTNTFTVTVTTATTTTAIKNNNNNNDDDIIPNYCREDGLEALKNRRQKIVMMKRKQLEEARRPNNTTNVGIINNNNNNNNDSNTTTTTTRRQETMLKWQKLQEARRGSGRNKRMMPHLMYNNQITQNYITCEYYKCNKRGMFVNNGGKCSGCCKISYCSTTCQENDWNRHEKECSYFFPQSSNKFNFYN